jgi:hypothetical protein
MAGRSADSEYCVCCRFADSEYRFVDDSEHYYLNIAIVEYVK